MGRRKPGRALPADPEVSAPGGAWFERLSRLFEEGHARPVNGLLSDARFAIASRTADAAVLIAVTERDEPGVILTRRPDTMRDHPGQVAFPGGKLEPGEDAVAAALREAEEELAIDPVAVQVIGVTDRYQTGTGFEITPVLATVPPGLPITPTRARWRAGSKRRCVGCSTVRIGRSDRCSGAGRSGATCRWITKATGSGA